MTDNASDQTAENGEQQVRSFLALFRQILNETCTDADVHALRDAAEGLGITAEIIINKLKVEGIDNDKEPEAKRKETIETLYSGLRLVFDGDRTEGVRAVVARNILKRLTRLSLTPDAFIALIDKPPEQQQAQTDDRIKELEDIIAAYVRQEGMLVGIVESLKDEANILRDGMPQGAIRSSWPRRAVYWPLEKLWIAADPKKMAEFKRLLANSLQAEADAKMYVFMDVQERRKLAVVTAELASTKHALDHSQESMAQLQQRWGKLQIELQHVHDEMRRSKDYQERVRLLDRVDNLEKDLLLAGVSLVALRELGSQTSPEFKTYMKEVGAILANPDRPAHWASISSNLLDSIQRLTRDVLDNAGLQHKLNLEHVLRQLTETNLKQQEDISNWLRGDEFARAALNIVTPVASFALTHFVSPWVGVSFGAAAVALNLPATSLIRYGYNRKSIDWVKNHEIAKLVLRQSPVRNVAQTVVATMVNTAGSVLGLLY